LHYLAIKSKLCQSKYLHYVCIHVPVDCTVAKCVCTRVCVWPWGPCQTAHLT